MTLRALILPWLALLPAAVVTFPAVATAPTELISPTERKQNALRWQSTPQRNGLTKAPPTRGM
jgi:hypothetical protein